MTTRPISPTSDYASGYAQGRHAAKEHVDARRNPYPSGGDAFHGWNDGHYDERSARRLAVERHRALPWSPGDSN